MPPFSSSYIGFDCIKKYSEPVQVTSGLNLKIKIIPEATVPSVKRMELRLAIFQFDDKRI